MAPSYSNPGGTGNRTSLITVFCTSGLFYQTSWSWLVNGVIGNDGYFYGAVNVAGKVIRFDFGVEVSKQITEAKWYQSGSYAQGTWKWQGSNDASSWTDIGDSFTLGGVISPYIQTITQLSGNLDGWRYYQMLGVSGATNGTPFIKEIEFKIDDGSIPSTITLPLLQLTI